MLGYFDVSIIHRSLTLTAGSLTCINDVVFLHMSTHRGPQFIVSAEGLSDSLKGETTLLKDQMSVKTTF